MDRQQCSDAQLVALILQADDAAFAVLVTRYHRRVYGITYRMLGNVAEAEDLCQEIFLRLYQQLPRYDQGMPFTPWLRRLACNQVLNHLKKRSLKITPLEIKIGNEQQPRPIAAGQKDPEQALMAKYQDKQLQQALLELPENYRLAFTLKYVEDLTAEEIGELLNIPRNTIKTWLVRAREALRGKLSHDM